jgi:pimeloyl-ACP methyl ester carboxylesterase
MHHYCYRDLLADPPKGLRIIAPDLPRLWMVGGGASSLGGSRMWPTICWSLLDALALERVLLVGHDWGAFIGYLLVLGAPQRFGGLMALSVPHPWNTPRALLPHMWRLGHMPLMAVAGRPLVQNTLVLEQVIFRLGVGQRDAISPQDVRWYADRFRDPGLRSGHHRHLPDLRAARGAGRCPPSGAPPCNRSDPGATRDRGLRRSPDARLRGHRDRR